MRWSSPKGNDYGEDNKSHDDTHFDTREPKFELPENPDSEIVDKNNECKENCNPYSRIDRRSWYPISTFRWVRWNCY